ncbi:MAG: M6 family metalloprotease domain-containing protein [candidate division Zixibacteria bacterium]|nr:M6 family metalloprotease domain-containing protein [candidate division Zixibacteria bacterium]
MLRGKIHFRAGATAITVMFLLLAFAGDAIAMPPYPGAPDDPQSATMAQALHQQYIDLQDGWREKGIDQPADIDFQDWMRSSATASKNILCILVRFPDLAPISADSYFDTLIYVNQSGSVRHYYNEVSFNQVDIITVDLPSSIGWLTAPNNNAYYVNGAYGTGSYPNNCQKLVEDAVDLADGLVDFSNYDNDSDGYVDGLMVVHTGEGAELTGSVNDIWSHKWAITPRLKDGKYIFTYAIMPEYWYSANDMTLGVFCHELGHVFGLPDLYDTDNSSRGIARWSLMASGSWNGSLGDSPAHFDAWCRIQLGFASYTNISTTSYGTSVPNVETSGKIFRLWTNGSASDEYYLVENRKKTGYDSYLPSAGLLIWHIDENVSDNNDEWYPGHTAFGHYEVALVQADNLWELEKNLDYGDTGDPFPGSTSNTAFTPLSTPGSNSYSGSESLVSVTNISAAGDTMTADFSVSFISDADDPADDPPLPESFSVEQNYPNPFNSATVISYSLQNAGEVEIEIFNILGQTVISERQDIGQPGAHSFEWDGRDSNGNEVPAGVYFYRLSVDEEQHDVKKMLFLK